MEQRPTIQFDEVETKNITLDEENRVVKEALKRETEIGLVQITLGQHQTIQRAANQEEEIDGKDI